MLFNDVSVPIHCFIQNMNLPIWTILSAALVIIFFAFALLAFILWLSSLLGWRRWSREYSGTPPAGSRPRYSFRTGGFAWWACYNNCLRVIPVPDGLLVRPIPPFLWFHPWILLPFQNLAGLPETSGFPKQCRLIFKGTGGLRFTLHLPPSAANLINQGRPQHE
jgi:hypothetical protein